jgi:hypothetical protein
MKIVISEEKVDKLRELIKREGPNYVANLVGGFDTLLKVVFNGDLKTYYKYTGYVPYKFSTNGEVMYIDELLIETLNLEDRGKEKKLGDFRWISAGMNYKVTAYAIVGGIKTQTGQILRKVAGISGDSGFGYNYVKHNIGKRGRAQIFKQIIDKYDLKSYSNENN